MADDMNERSSILRAARSKPRLTKLVAGTTARNQRSPGETERTASFLSELRMGDDMNERSIDT